MDLPGNSVLQLRNVGKMYRLYRRPHDKLKEFILWRMGFFHSIYQQEFWALKDVSLDVLKGQTIAFLGQNGSGKSTLLQIIAGVLQPTTGSITVSGRVSALLELGAGFNSEFTGRENVFMNGAILGIPHNEMKSRLKEIQDFADIGDFFDMPVKTYSSGMYVRLAFATAVQVDPDILIVDEALAVGDMNFQSKCYRKIEEIQKKGKTILFVSHDLSMVQSLCSSVVLLDRGQVLHVGQPIDGINEYRRLMALRLEEQFRQGRGGERKEVSKVPTSEVMTDSTTRKGEVFRYGNGLARFIDYQIMSENGELSDHFLIGETIVIRLKAEFLEQCDRPSIGVLIRTLSGIEIGGTSTFHQEKEVTPMSAGETLTVEFSYKNTLYPGQYSVSFGVSEVFESGGSFRVLDRLFDPLLFRVSGTPKGYGLLDIGIEVRKVEIESPRRFPGLRY